MNIWTNKSWDAKHTSSPFAYDVYPYFMNKFFRMIFIFLYFTQYCLFYISLTIVHIIYTLGYQKTKLVNFWLHNKTYLSYRLRCCTFSILTSDVFWHRFWRALDENWESNLLMDIISLPDRHHLIYIVMFTQKQFL